MHVTQIQKDKGSSEECLSLKTATANLCSRGIPWLYKHLKIKFPSSHLFSSLFYLGSIFSHRIPGNLQISHSLICLPWNWVPSPLSPIVHAGWCAGRGWIIDHWSRLWSSHVTAEPSLIRPTRYHHMVSWPGRLFLLPLHHHPSLCCMNVQDTTCPDFPEDSLTPTPVLQENRIPLERVLNSLHPALYLISLPKEYFSH